ncbi:UNVERIFIED_CONTAM: hypothetical protein Sradi_6870300 [Sesamum radiatum]|uniref:Integrase catalytic domain-containing protein n=1 Tax=Sesamum radiatum TaxID=300843 RepID=A0AAW2JKM0_SESRA
MSVPRMKNTGMVPGIAYQTKVHISGSPQSNGQVEVTNRILVQGIKRRLERVGGNWTEELISVLWVYRTTPRGSTGESPFSLVYRLEAIIPAELGTPSHRILFNHISIHSQKKPPSLPYSAFRGPLAHHFTILEHITIKYHN